MAHDASKNGLGVAWVIGPPEVSGIDSVRLAESSIVGLFRAGEVPKIRARVISLWRNDLIIAYPAVRGSLTPSH